MVIKLEKMMIELAKMVIELEKMMIELAKMVIELEKMMIELAKMVIELEKMMTELEKMMIELEKMLIELDFFVNLTRGKWWKWWFSEEKLRFTIYPGIKWKGETRSEKISSCWVSTSFCFSLQNNLASFNTEKNVWYSKL